MRRIASAAALIAALTVASRLAGFARTLVFNWAVGPTDLGDIYLAANTVPNIIFEIVAGGALASLVVPLLAGPAARGDRAAVAATTSALLTWTVGILTPIATVVALAAEPIIAAIAGPASPDQLASGAAMLRVFAPQLPLYGIGIVLTGVLQAHHRFAWPVLAPLLSSVTVIGVYVTFVVIDGRGADLSTASRTGELVLSVGTTLGVAVLTLCLLIPLRGLALPLRPSVRFPAGIRSAVAGLAIAGAVTVGAQQIALVVALRYALAGPEGTVVLYQLAQTVYLLPWAVLAVPVATAAYPVLAASDGAEFRDTLARTTRAALLLSCFGAAVLVAAAGPGARLLVAVMPAGGADAADLAGALAWFAPGLLGYGLSAVLTRALYARGEPALAAGATAAGWVTVALASAALAALLPVGRRVVALSAANSVGMALLGAALLAVTARRAGRAALDGTPRAAVAGVVGGGVAALAGAAAGGLLPATPGAGTAVAQGMLSVVTACLVFVAAVYLADRDDMRPVLARLSRWRVRQ